MGKIAHKGIPWAEMPILLALAEEKTISGAAKKLSVDRTTISRRIEAMELKVGRKLFDRIDGKFELTSLGRKAAAAVERAQQELAVFDQSLANERHYLGKVHLSLPPHFSITMAEPLARFQRDNPGILLEVSATDTLKSLKQFETDVAIRVAARVPQGTTAYDFGPIFHCLFHSADKPVDLTRYISLAGFDDMGPEVRAHLPDAEVVMSVDGYVLMREYITQGVGVGLLPNSLGIEDSRLTIIPNFKVESELRTWLVCLPEQRRLHRVNTLMQFLQREMSSAISV
ncbi:LysR family transcriptional regulator [Vibrio sp. VB16]|uniref:LysR family transcriptional regulator n=1 Tax=Vibrio sp. VB16 TaxID=2785746 RepID=UPI00189F7492|nr:LysR family transcriptional regulator [Vibrio sp. VB16]UGA53573.1 LysR family transcriptional regulator [Vibrio sp. VB16]